MLQVSWIQLPMLKEIFIIFVDSTLWYLVHCQTMKKVSNRTRLILLKTGCTVLAIVLFSSLFAAGAMSADGCRLKCCCQSQPIHIQSSVDVQLRAPMGCCSGNPQSPCDLQSARPFELPEIILTSNNTNNTNFGGPIVVLTDSKIDWLCHGSNLISQVIVPKFNSPPLYLQKSTFLI